MRTLSAAFLATLAFAHLDGSVLSQPLSMFRDGDQWLVGVVLFLLLITIGAVLIRTLWSLRGHAGASVLAVSLMLLLIVAITPSVNDLHNVCAFGLLSLAGLYFTIWLNLEKPSWLWPHLAVTAIILFGAAFYSYGFWQKSLIVYLVVLMNVQFSVLRGMEGAPPLRLHPAITELTAMRTLSVAFPVTLAVAQHDGNVLPQPLSMFLDGNQRFVGVVLFLLLMTIGVILVRKLSSLRGYVGASVLGFSLLLLLIVAVTPSGNDLHNVCAFGLLSLMGFYYTMWLNLEKPYWLWPHLAVIATILFGAAFFNYVFWLKTLTVYLVLLMNVQFSFLRGISPQTGVQYTLMSGDSASAPLQVSYRLEREFFGKREGEP